MPVGKRDCSNSALGARYELSDKRRGPATNVGVTLKPLGVYRIPTCDINISYVSGIKHFNPLSTRGVRTANDSTRIKSLLESSDCNTTSLAYEQSISQCTALGSRKSSPRIKLKWIIATTALA